MFISIRLNRIIYFGIIIIISIFVIFLAFKLEENLSFSITSKSEYKVVIDPGHGSIDTGTSYNDIYEKNINLNLAKKIKNNLIKANIIPIMTRTTDKLYQNDRNKDIRHRPRIVKENNADLFISIHANNFPTSQPSGSQVFYRPNSKESKQLANYIYQELVQLRTANDRKVSPGNYYVLKKTNVPAVLIEAGFLSNPEDRIKLTDPSYQKAFAKSVTDGITKYLQSKLGGADNLEKTYYKPKIKSAPTKDVQLFYIKTKKNNYYVTSKKFSHPTLSETTQYQNKKYNEILLLSALKQLINPPANLVSTIPTETIIKSVDIINKTATINFSRELKNNFTGGAGTELLTLKTITSTVFSIPGIDELKILIDGKKHSSIGGHIILNKINKKK